MSELIQWIEKHSVTVDLLKWMLVLALAWGLGLFRFLRARLKKPRLEIESFTSRCFWNELGNIDGHDDNVQVIFLIEAGITNPTTEPIFVRDFTLQIKRLRRWPTWHHSLNAVTLPNRVRQNVGGVTKLLKNWFSYFEEGSETLTLTPLLQPREFQSGFLLFVSVSWGDLKPREMNGFIPVRLKARLTTGEIVIANAFIKLERDYASFESVLPGIFEHVKSPSTWNLIREKI